MKVVRKPSLHLPISPILFVVAVLFTCSAATISVLLLRPHAIHSYEDQVADALRRHQISYQHVRLGTRWPDHINFQYGEHVFPYSYQITVVRQHGITSDGWLTCAKLEHECTLNIADLDLKQVPVRDFTHTQALPIPDWIAQYLPAFVAMVLPQ